MDELGANRNRGRGRVVRQLPEVRAAQLRTQTVRWAIGKIAFGMLFLVGAMSHTLAPDPRSGSTAVWMALLVVLSTFHIGLGLRALSRVRRRGTRLWLPATLAWGLLATVMLRILTDR
jgi:succinate dehydrogenase hydrophobic anchor subunit